MTLSFGSLNNFSKRSMGNGSFLSSRGNSNGSNSKTSITPEWLAKSVVDEDALKGVKDDTKIRKTETYDTFMANTFKSEMLDPEKILQKEKEEAAVKEQMESRMNKQQFTKEVAKNAVALVNNGENKIKACLQAKADLVKKLGYDPTKVLNVSDRDIRVRVDKDAIENEDVLADSKNKDNKNNEIKEAGALNDVQAEDKKQKDLTNNFFDTSRTENMNIETVKLSEKADLRDKVGNASAKIAQLEDEISGFKQVAAGLSAQSVVNDIKLAIDESKDLNKSISDFEKLDTMDKTQKTTFAEKVYDFFNNAQTLTKDLEEEQSKSPLSFQYA